MDSSVTIERHTIVERAEPVSTLLVGTTGCWFRARSGRDRHRFALNLVLASPLLDDGLRLGVGIDVGRYPDSLPVVESVVVERRPTDGLEPVADGSDDGIVGFEGVVEDVFDVIADDQVDVPNALGDGLRAREREMYAQTIRSASASRSSVTASRAVGTFGRMPYSSGKRGASSPVFRGVNPKNPTVTLPTDSIVHRSLPATGSSPPSSRFADDHSKELSSMRSWSVETP